MTAEDATAWDEPEIVVVAPGLAAVAWGRVPFTEIPAYHRAARARVDAALAAAGITPVGPWLTFSRTPSDGVIAIAPGVRVDAVFDPSDGVTIETIPSGQAAHLRLHGPYERLPQAWGALLRWIDAQGRPAAGPSWEIYTDTSGPVTDLYVMLA